MITNIYTPKRNENTTDTSGSVDAPLVAEAVLDSKTLPPSPVGDGGAWPHQGELDLYDEPPPLTAFDVFKTKHPLAKSQLTAAARMAVGSFGKCSIHLAYELAVIEYGLHCSRNWLPALAREIITDCVDLAKHIKTRRSQFDSKPRP